MILLDTHAWIWWVSDQKKLSKKALEVVNSAMTENKIFISTISSWEIAMLVKSQRLEISLPIAEWIRTCERLPFFRFIPLSNDICLQSVNLPGKFHKDPADRLIVSTALKSNLKIVTKDKKIQNYSYVDSVW